MDFRKQQSTENQQNLQGDHRIASANPSEKKIPDFIRKAAELVKQRESKDNLPSYQSREVRKETINNIKLLPFMLGEYLSFPYDFDLHRELIYRNIKDQVISDILAIQDHIENLAFSHKKGYKVTSPVPMDNINNSFDKLQKNIKNVEDNLTSETLYEFDEASKALSRIRSLLDGNPLSYDSIPLSSTFSSYESIALTSAPPSYESIPFLRVQDRSDSNGLHGMTKEKEVKCSIKETIIERIEEAKTVYSDFIKHQGLLKEIAKDRAPKLADDTPLTFSTFKQRHENLIRAFSIAKMDPTLSTAIQECAKAYMEFLEMKDKLPDLIMSYTRSQEDRET